MLIDGLSLTKDIPMTAVEEYQFWQSVIDENMDAAQNYASVGRVRLFEYFYEQASRAYGEQLRCEAAIVFAWCSMFMQSREAE